MSNQPLRIIFAGTPEFAAQHLQVLVDSEHQILAVYSQPDRPAGRGRKLTASPVKQLALANNIDVQQPLTLKDAEAQAHLAAYKADIMIVVAYGLLLPKAVLNTPRLGCINVHASLLPRWRGAAPIQRALLAGDKETGVTIMQMEAGLDTGPMLLKQHTAITATDTSASLHDKLAACGSRSLVEALKQITSLMPETQDDSQANYANKLIKEEGLIDWQASALATSRQVRGLNPWPVAYTDYGEQRLRIWLAEAKEPSLTKLTNEQAGAVTGYSKQGIHVACGEGELLITQLQWPGGKAVAGAQLKNLQQRLPIGSVLGAAK